MGKLYGNGVEERDSDCDPEEVLDDDEVLDSSESETEPSSEIVFELDGDVLG